MFRGCVLTAFLVLGTVWPITSVMAQVDCSQLDPRASVSKEMEGKVKLSVDTLYKIAKAGGSIEGRVKDEIYNLQKEVPVTEQGLIKLRTLYLFCGMVANAKDLSTERKVELFRVMMEVKTTDEPKPKPHTQKKEKPSPPSKPVPPPQGEKPGVTTPQNNPQQNPQTSVTSHNQSGGITAQNVTIYNYFDKNFSQAAAFQQYLKGKYPLGYAVFAGDGKTVNVPSGLTFERDFELKWANAKVFKLESDMIYLDLPDIVYKPTGNVLTNVGFGFPRKVGYVAALPLVNWKQTIPIIEVLADEGDFVVLALGFREKR